MRLLTKFETWLGLVAWLCDRTWWFRAFFILRATQKKACRQSEVARLYLFIFPPTWDLTDQVGKEEPKEICLSAPPPTPTHSELGFVEQTLFNRDRFFNFTSCKIIRTCAQSDSFTWLMFNCLTLFQSSLSLCSWACLWWPDSNSQAGSSALWLSLTQTG